MSDYLPHLKRILFAVFTVTLLTLPIDQLTKSQARSHFLIVDDPSDTTIYQGRREEMFSATTAIFWISLTKTYIRNHGASWGVWANHEASWRRPVLIFVGLVATMGLFYAAIKLSIGGALLPALALCGIVSGSFGNLLDRLRYGYVVDFLTIKLGVWGHVFVLPAFNVADIIIVLSLVLLIITIMKTPTLDKTNP